MVPLVAGAAYYALFGGEYSLMESRKLERERLREQERLTATRSEVVTLRARADSLQHDSATLERIAREKYGLIKEGERLYRFVDSAHTNAARADTLKPSATH
ncbi:MAG TPA: septum formation initiator family protein [Longimicrobiales bacterium]|nr:septum formation initiator family protein [Longimicrobiales bacterium]